MLRSIFLLWLHKVRRELNFILTVINGVGNFQLIGAALNVDRNRSDLLEVSESSIQVIVVDRDCQEQSKISPGLW